MFCPADKGGTVPDESELKAVVLGSASDHGTKGGQAIWLGACSQRPQITTLRPWRCEFRDFLRRESQHEPVRLR